MNNVELRYIFIAFIVAFIGMVVWMAFQAIMQFLTIIAFVIALTVCVFIPCSALIILYHLHMSFRMEEIQKTKPRVSRKKED